MPDAVAFALKESADNFVDAAVAVPPDGRPLSVGERLKEGKGAIVTDDPSEIEALDGLDVLKQLSGKDAEKAIEKAAKAADTAAKSSGKE